MLHTSRGQIAHLAVAALILWLASGPAMAQNAGSFDFGGDRYAGGQTVVLQTPVDRNAFAGGSDVSITAPVGGSAHLAGFNVGTSGAVAGDVYATGYAVNISGAVGGDVTAAGNSVSVTGPQVGGNVRLTGATVRLAAPIAGSALIAAGTLALDGTIGGDLSFSGSDITFGPEAIVAGTLTIHAPEPIAVPASVVPPERIHYEPGTQAGGFVGSGPVLWTAGIGWLVLVLVGAAFIVMAPGTVATLQHASERGSFRKLGLGILTFATVLGLVPVAILTLIGVLLLPLVLLFVAIACLLAYLAGSFLVGRRLAGTFMAVVGRGRQLAVLAIALAAAALLALVPWIGWFVSLLLVLFGFGTIAATVMGGGAARPVAGS